MSTTVETVSPAETTEVASRASRRLAGKAVRGGTVLLVARLVMQLFTWAVTLIVARILLPDDYGLMTMASVFLVLADLLAEAGFGKALIQKNELTSEDVASAFTVSLALSAALYGLLFAMAGDIEGFLHLPGFARLLQVLGLMVLLVPFRSIPLALLDRDLRLGQQAAAHVMFSVVQSGMVLGLALAGAGYWALAAGAMTARVLEVAFLWYVSGWRPRICRPGPGTWGMLRFGMHVSFGSLLWYVYSNCDFAIVGKLIGPTALGYYALAFQLISLPVQKLTANANQVVYPVFCRLRNDPERMRDWYLRLTVLLGFLGMPALAGMALVADDAFALILGRHWQPAVLPFQLLSVVGILMIYGSTLPPLFNALGRPDINPRYTAACTLLYPAAFAIGGTIWGVTGVCVAWLILYPIMISSLAALTRRLTGVGPITLLWAQRQIVAAVLFMSVVVLGVSSMMQGSDRPWLRLSLCIAAGVAAYAGVLLAFARNTVLADLRALVREMRGSRKSADSC